MSFCCDQCIHTATCKFKDNLINVISMFDNAGLPPGVSLTGMCELHDDSKNPKKLADRGKTDGPKIIHMNDGDDAFRDNLTKRYGRDVYEMED